jgi:radical SAM superfamily enzyme YgiQ (UPF0313 family)
MNKLVCLVKIDNRIYEDIPPLGMLYIGDALKKAGYDVEVYHILGSEVEEYGKRIIERAPLFAGFSVVTGWGIKPAADLSRIVNEAGRIPVVWGNVHPSHMPEQCLREGYIDIVCMGEGEVTAVELARALEAGSDLSGIAGIGYKDNGSIVINQRRSHVADLDRYEADWSLVDMDRYIAPCWGIRKTLRVTASRGCPFNCSFCYNQAFNQRRWRRHSAEYVISRLTDLTRTAGVEAFYFNDDNFFVDQEWAWTVLDGIKCPYYVSLRSELVDEEFAQRLSQTGCRELLIGFESGSDRVLREILNKGSTTESHRRAVRLLSRYPRMQLTGSLMAGVPGETEDDLRATIRMVCEFLELHPNIRIQFAFYRPMPGTDLYNVAIENGFVPPEDTEGWSSFDARSNTLDLPWLDDEQSRELEAICRDMETLAALYKFNVPILKSWLRNRVIAGDLDHPMLRAMNSVRVRYAFGEDDHWSNRALRGAVERVKRWKNLGSN